MKRKSNTLSNLYSFKMNLPSDEEVFELIEWAKVPKNIRKHCIMVNAVSQFLAKKLIEKNININFDLIDKASILHDLFRYVDIDEWRDGNFEEYITDEHIKKWTYIKKKYINMTHEEVAYHFLKETYPRLAQVIRMHKFKKVLTLKSIEEKIVTYADKRSKHNSIVSLSERFRDGRIRNYHLIKKHGIKDEEINIYERAFFNLEKEIFDIIKIDPNNLDKEIDTFINSKEYHNWNKLLIK